MCETFCPALRDLLKSTLIVSGCAQYAADHVLGHSPNDSYEKQAMLYPEKMRSEYAKASGLLNIFTNIERYLRMTGVDFKRWQEEEKEEKKETTVKVDRYQRIEAQQEEMQITLQKMTDTVAKVLKIIMLGKEENTGDISKDILLKFVEMQEDGEKEDDT